MAFHQTSFANPIVKSQPANQRVPAACGGGAAERLSCAFALLGRSHSLAACSCGPGIEVVVMASSNANDEPST